MIKIRANKVVNHFQLVTDNLTKDEIVVLSRLIDKFLKVSKVLGLTE